jgi:hypothetical protein
MTAGGGAPAGTPLDGSPRAAPGQRRALTIAAGAVALVTFAFAAVTLARGCQGRAWEPMTLEFAGDLPLEDAGRSGPEVAGTLRDPTWQDLPAEKRRDQMSAALRALPDGVEVFFVRDPAGGVLASARWYGKVPRQIAVTLR